MAACLALSRQAIRCTADDVRASDGRKERVMVHNPLQSPYAGVYGWMGSPESARCTGSPIFSCWRSWSASTKCQSLCLVTSTNTRR